MARFRKSRSTKEGRQHAYERFVELMRSVPTLTDDQICERISGILHFRVEKEDKETREQLVVSLAVHGAKLIVDA